MTRNAAKEPARPGAPRSAQTLPASRLLLLGALAALAPMSVDIQLPTIPAMAEALEAGAGLVQLSVSLFLVALALGQVVHGALSDRWGRRPVLLSGLAIYLLGTGLCLWSDSIGSMLGGRALQAFGSSACAVLARAVIRDQCRGPGVAHALSITAALMMVLGPIAGPLLGSALLEWQGWRSVFWAMLAFGAACALLAALGLEETRPSSAKPEGSGLVWALSGYLIALRHRPLRRYLACEVLVAVGMFTYVASSPFLFIRHLGASPTTFAGLFSLMAVGWAAGTAASGWLAPRVGAHQLLRVGLALLCLGAGALMALVCVGVTHVWAFGATLFFAVGPSVMLRANFTALGMEDMPHIAGTAGALFGAAGLLMGGIASGLVGLLGAVNPLPLACVMLASALGATAVYAWTRRRGGGQAAETAA